MPKASRSSPPITVPSPTGSAHQKDHISKPMNSWMLFWQEFVKYVRLKGESMTDAGARASMLWAAMAPEEKGEWEERAAEDRKAHAATLQGWKEFVPPIAQKHKRTRRTRSPADGLMSAEVPGRSSSAVDSPELVLLRATSTSPMSSLLAFPGSNCLEANYHDASSFFSAFPAASLSGNEALYNGSMSIAAELHHPQPKRASDLYPPFNELLYHNSTSFDSSTSSCSLEIPPGSSTTPVPPDLFDLEPNNPESEFDRALRQFLEQDPVLLSPFEFPASYPKVTFNSEIAWDRSAIDGDFRTDTTTSDFFDWESFLADLGHDTTSAATL